METGGKRKWNAIVNPNWIRANNTGSIHTSYDEIESIMDIILEAKQMEKI